jgi:mannose-6-phosphate isomerase-like protein (cupin superfamily)
MTAPVDLTEAFAQLDRPWSPLTIALVNDYEVRIAKCHGEFSPHSHPDTDELFLVVRGELSIRLDGGDEAHLRPGQLYVVPRGTRHQPYSVAGAEVLLIEPSSTVNTGDTPSELTARRRVDEGPDAR